MKKLSLVTALLASTALVSMPALAAESASDLSRQLQMLQDQLRTVQQQLDALKSAEAASKDAIAKETEAREAAARAARQQALDAGSTVVMENGQSVIVAPKMAHVTESGAHKFALESADGQYSIGLTGRLHFDTGGYLDFTPKSPVVGPRRLTSGVNARRARIGVTGKVFGDWSYTFIYDGGNSQDTTAGGIQTAQITYNGFKDVIIDLPGYSEPPSTMEYAMSSNDLVLMERSTPSNLAAGINAGDFRANTGVRFIDDKYWIGAYFTGPQSSTDSHTTLHERFGAFQRASVQVLTGPNYSLHIGGSIDELFNAPDTGVGTAHQLTMSDRPELRIDPSALLSTGAMGSVANPVTGATVFGGEVGGGYDSLFFMGEYFHYDVKRRGLATANFDGMYGQVSYTLTGEHRSYNRATGTYGSITPAHPVSLKTGDIGAWEIAARISYADLTDNFVYGLSQAAQPSAVNGGKQTDYTVGINWYLNTYMRMMFNYVHSDLKKINGTAVAGAPVGAPIGSRLDGFAARLQLAW